MTRTELHYTISIQYQYNIKETSDDNKELYKLRDYELIQNQILQTNIIRIVWQTVRRIINESDLGSERVNVIDFEACHISFQA